MKKIVAVTFLLGVSACVATPDQVTPIVSQFNGDSVSIQLDNGLISFMSNNDKKTVFKNADMEALRICKQGHKKRAEYTSTRVISTGPYTSLSERLYLCLN